MLEDIKILLEGPDYYQRKLSDSEAMEIEKSLIDFGEIILDFVKNHESEGE